MLKFSSDVLSSHTAHENGGTQHGAFEGGFAIYPPNACQFAYSVESGYWLALPVQHLARQVDSDSAQAFASQWKELQRIKRWCLDLQWPLLAVGFKTMEIGVSASCDKFVPAVDCP